MLRLFLLLLASMGPGLLWLWYFYRQDRFEPEPIKEIIKGLFNRGLAGDSSRTNRANLAPTINGLAASLGLGYPVNYGFSGNRTGGRRVKGLLFMADGGQ